MIDFVLNLICFKVSFQHISAICYQNVWRENSCSLLGGLGPLRVRSPVRQSRSTLCFLHHFHHFLVTCCPLSLQESHFFSTDISTHFTRSSHIHWTILALSREPDNATDQQLFSGLSALYWNMVGGHWGSAKVCIYTSFPWKQSETERYTSDTTI